MTILVAAKSLTFGQDANDPGWYSSQCSYCFETYRPLHRFSENISDPTQNISGKQSSHRILNKIGITYSEIYPDVFPWSCKRSTRSTSPWLFCLLFLICDSFCSFMLCFLCKEEKTLVEPKVDWSGSHKIFWNPLYITLHPLRILLVVPQWSSQHILHSCNDD